MIGNEVVAITDPLNFSPQFPGTYTISYSYTNKQGKVISASTKCIFKSIDAPVEVNMQKWNIPNPDIDPRNKFRNALAERLGIHNIQALAIDVLEYDGLKNISQAEAIEKAKKLTPLIIDREISSEGILDGGKQLVNQQDSWNRKLDNNNIFDDS